MMKIMVSPSIDGDNSGTQLPSGDPPSNEAAASEANAKFRAFFEQGSSFAGLMTLDGTLIEANRLSLEACGFTREDVIGRKFWDTGWWSPSAEIVELIRHGAAEAAQGRQFRCETAYFLADGSTRMVDLIIAPVKDEHGRVLFIAPTGIDISERLRAEAVNRRLAIIVECSEDAIVSKDLNGIIQSWNAGAQNLFGYSEAEAIGRSITMIIPGDRIDEESSILERIRSGKRIAHYETIRRRKDGSLVEISLSISPITDSRGKIIGASKIARDITDAKRAERALLEADRQKNEFLATLAHELRNPLAPIRDSLNILRLLEGQNEATVRVQEVMERQVNHMVRLVDDLLEMSRITTGKIDLRVEPVDVSSFIRSAVETSRPLIEAHRHTLELKLPPEPISIDGDPMRLSQVVANILNNAAKYTDPGGRIILEVSEPKDYVQIAVRDTGIGISADLLPRVLEMFTQSDRAKRHSQDGLGIGLALVKRLVELHGGMVEARSEGEGKGSEFIVRLPRSRKPLATPAQEARRKARQVLHQRILVVDDNRDAASSLAMLLKLMGAEVEMVHEGEAALMSVTKFRPTLILLDLGMPDITGYEVARRIRQIPEFENVIIVALTGWGQEEDRRRTREAGFNHHLVKPVNLEALQILISGKQGQSGDSAV